MTLDDVKQHYGSYYRCMKVIGLSRHAYQSWVRQGFIPYVSQTKIEKDTQGMLKVCEEQKDKHEQRRKEMSETAKQREAKKRANR